MSTQDIRALCASSFRLRINPLPGLRQKFPGIRFVASLDKLPPLPAIYATPSEFGVWAGNGWVAKPEKY